jgi:hypothetical protein
MWPLTVPFNSFPLNFILKKKKTKARRRRNKSRKDVQGIKKLGFGKKN